MVLQHGKVLYEKWLGEGAPGKPHVLHSVSKTFTSTAVGLAVGEGLLSVDDKVIYTFHCYEPLIFTHQGAPWVAGMDTSFRMPFASTYRTYSKNSSTQVDAFKNLELAAFKAFDPDQVLGAEYFERMLAEAVRVAEERNVALYCGEFGVIDRAQAKDVLAWYQTFIKVMDRHGIGRAAWSYKQMDFGLVDPYVDPVREELLKLI